MPENSKSNKDTYPIVPIQVKVPISLGQMLTRVEIKIYCKIGCNQGELKPIAGPQLRLELVPGL